MRVTAVAILFLLGAASSARASPPENRPGSAAIDLGAEVLGHGENLAGPFQLARGIGDRLMIGTYTLPWFTSFLAKGSIAPNAFVKLRLFRSAGLTAAIKSSLFYVRLNDIDRDQLKVRSILWPTRLFLSRDWSSRWSTSLEFTSVYVQATGRGLADNDSHVHGVAVANNYHVGAIQRVRVADSIHLWGRFRTLLEHAPVIAEGSAPLSESARIRVRARASSAELRSGYAAMAGVHWEWRRLRLVAGLGYGTWILPWVYLPVGKNTLSAELDLAYRF